jgi:hypothetical protein
VVKGTKAGRDKTPESLFKIPCRGASTPTEGENASETVLDAWDASEICTVGSSQNLNETSAAPISALFSVPPTSRDHLESTLLHDPSRPSMNTSRRSFRGKVRPSTTAKPRSYGQTAAKVPSTSLKPGVLLEETLDPEAVSEEELDLAYSRYVQSEFIKMQSQKALERAKKECSWKLYEGWKLLEAKRYETITNMQQLVDAQLIADIQDILNTIGPIAVGSEGGEGGQGLISQMKASGAMLSDLLDGLQNLNHNIQVKGLQIDPREREVIIRDLISNLHPLSTSILQRTGDLAPIINKMEMTSRFCEASERMCKAGDLCTSLLKTCQRLATKEASLRLSFASLQAGKENISPDVDKAPSDTDTKHSDVDSNTPGVDQTPSDVNPKSPQTPPTPTQGTPISTKLHPMSVPRAPTLMST